MKNDLNLRVTKAMNELKLDLIESNKSKVYQKAYNDVIIGDNVEGNLKIMGVDYRKYNIKSTIRWQVICNKLGEFYESCFQRGCKNANMDYRQTITFTLAELSDYCKLGYEQEKYFSKYFKNALELGYLYTKADMIEKVVGIGKSNKVEEMESIIDNIESEQVKLKQLTYKLIADINNIECFELVGE